MSKDIENSVSTLIQTTTTIVNCVYQGEKKNGLGGQTTMDKWNFLLTNGRTGLMGIDFDFYTGLGHRKFPKGFIVDKTLNPRCIAYAIQEKNKKPIPPNVASMLHSLISDSSACNESFSSWCDNFGYDSDSRKALSIYEACQENGDKQSKVFDRKTIEKLSELLQDY
jgi:hypothetical protein